MMRYIGLNTRDMTYTLRTIRHRNINTRYRFGKLWCRLSWSLLTQKQYQYATNNKYIEIDGLIFEHKFQNTARHNNWSAVFVYGTHNFECELNTIDKRITKLENELRSLEVML